MRITQVATQGRQDYDQWVTRYTISSSVDSTHWAMYRDKSQDKVTRQLLISRIAQLVVPRP